MKVHGIDWWQGIILKELNKPTNKQFTKPSSLPQNVTEQMNFDIAEELLRRNKEIISNKEKNNSLHYNLVA